MRDISRWSKVVGIVVLGILIIGSISNVSALSAFHDGFEYGDTLAEMGYVIDRQADPDMTIETSQEAAIIGSQGLEISSILEEGVVSLSKTLDLEWRDDLYFSIHGWLISGQVTIRIELADENSNVLGLDYGKEGGTWESDVIYDVDSQFPIRDLHVINRNIQTDILNSLNDDRVTYQEYDPQFVHKIIIFQDTPDVENKIYLDDILINYFGNPLLQVETLTSNSDVEIAPSTNLVQMTSVLIVLTVLVGRRPD